MEVLYISTPPVPIFRSNLWHHILHLKNGGSKGFRNIGILAQPYTVSQPRKCQVESSPL